MANITGLARGFAARGGTLASIVAGAAILCAPAIINGAPFLLTDTNIYAFAGQAALGHLLGGSALPSEAQQQLSVLLGARSAYYGLFLFSLERAGTLWAVVAAQALASAWLVHAAVRAIFDEREHIFYIPIIVALTALTSLPVFVGFMMPDIFAGLALLALALLTVFPSRFNCGERAALASFLALALSAHLSHLLTALLIGAGGIAFALARRDLRVRPTRFAFAGAAIVSGLLMSVFGTALLREGSYPARAPPFLTARLLEAGPGRHALPEICAYSAYAICAFRDRPLTRSGDILWSDDPATGVFHLSTFSVKERLAIEDRSFALAVFVREPIAVIGAGALATIRQFSAFGMDAELRADAARWRLLPADQYLPRVLDRIGACKIAASCRPRLPFTPMIFIQIAVVGVALFYLAVEALDVRRRALTIDQRRLAALAGIVVAGLILNAALCGGLSGVFPRYQARVAWLIPMVALFWALQQRRWEIALRLIPVRLASRPRPPPPKPATARRPRA